MRYKAGIIPLLLLCTGLAALAAIPRGEASVIKRIYAKLDGNLERRNTRPLLAVLAPNAMLKSFNGKTMSREAYVDRLVMSAWTLRESRMRTTVEKVIGDSQKQVVTVKRQISGIGQGPSDGPTQVVIVSTVRDTWVKTKTGWKLQSSIELKNSFTVDGKPVFPSQ